MLHVLSEAAQVHDVFFELWPRDKGATPFLAEGVAFGLETVEGLTGSHAADLVDTRQLLSEARESLSDNLRRMRIFP